MRGRAISLPQVFEYDTSPGALGGAGPVLGLEEGQVSPVKGGAGRHMVRSKGDADSAFSAALTVLLERLPLPAEAEADEVAAGAPKTEL